MNSEKILASARDGVAELMLNKPAKLNALDQEMLADIEHWFSVWEGEGSVSVVVLGSTGNRAFCVGADIEVLSHLTVQSMQEWEMIGNRVLDRLQSSSLVSIASIPGYAFGGGLTLAAACDFRVCASQSQFAQPEIDLGWVPGWGGVRRLARLVGVPRAKDLCMTGRRITALEAQGAGLVDRIVEGGELMEQARRFASELAARQPEALRGIKALAESGGTGQAAHHLDALLNSSLLHNDKARAAIEAFLNKSK
jgi:enoyl-CoA hydratase